MKDIIAQLVQENVPHMVKHRRHIHANPEVSFQEYGTKRYIIQVLEEIGVAYKEFDDNCAVIARIEGKCKGKTIAFRADMDALSLQEESKCEYKSTNDGVMHACGHDGHTAVLLGLAHALSSNTDLLSGTVILIFQHAEEMLPGGAKTLIENGVLNGVDEVYGMHVWPSLPVGEVGYTKKEMMACADMFELIFTGDGGHGSQPHMAQDIVLCCCATITQLNYIISRSISAQQTAVLTICEMHAGSAFNVIPNRASCKGTVRTFSNETQDTIIKRIQEICNSIAQIYGTKAEVNYKKGYPALVNDATIVSSAIEAITAATNNIMLPVEPAMVGEDFSYYLQQTPGAYFLVGCSNPNGADPYELHMPTFTMDERALNVGLSCFLSLCLNQQ